MTARRGALGAFRPRSLAGPAPGAAARPAPRPLGGLRLAVACGVLLVGAGTAQAQLFGGDDEARKAILELRARVASTEETQRQQIAALQASNRQLGEELAALRRSLLDLNAQIEALRTEVARGRGSDEQLARDVADLQKRQKDIAQALDDRLRKLEPMKVSVDGVEIEVDAAEKRDYDEAIALLRGGDFDRAAVALAAFQKRWPNSGYTDSVRFWLGNAQYGRRDYKEAVATFRAFVTASPKHPRAPEALLALANSQIEMKDTRTARRTLDELIKAYPQSEAAVAGKERLAVLPR